MPGFQEGSTEPLLAALDGSAHKARRRATPIMRGICGARDEGRDREPKLLPRLSTMAREETKAWSFDQRFGLQRGVNVTVAEAVGKLPLAEPSARKASDIYHLAWHFKLCFAECPHLLFAQFTSLPVSKQMP